MTQTLSSTTALERLAEILRANDEALVNTPPPAGVIEPTVRASLVQGTTTRVQVHSGRHQFTIDEPASLGGDDHGANPVEHLLAALGSCQVISYQVWAAKLGLEVDSIDINLTGTLDVRGFFGLDANVRPGFQSIHVEASITGPEDPERYRELTSVVERYCPVLDVLNEGTKVTAEVTHAA
ncbi:MAG: OsmC family protein [Brooklawnia sp.]